MSWVTITATDLTGIIADPVLRAVSDAALADGAVNPVTSAINDTIAIFRAKIGTNSSNVLDADTTLIPPDLKRHALWYVAREVMDRLGNAAPPSDAQKERFKAADDALEAVTSGKLRVTKPANPATVRDTQQRIGVQVVTTSTPRYGAPDQNGVGGLNGLI